VLPVKESVMMKLHELSDNDGATHRKKRRGRGPGSGLGKMGGRGIKGQTSRSGVAIKGFEGGQMPIHRRLPKRGFNSLNRKEFAVVNTGQLQAAIDRGAVDASQAVTLESLIAGGVVRRARKHGLRILGKGELNASLTITAAGASAGAKEIVSKAGGSINIVAVAPEPAKEKAAE